MMKIKITLLLLLAFGLFYGKSTAQDGNLQLTGIVADSTGNPLIGATVVLLQVKDSVMASFALSNSKGAFRLENLSVGDYYLQITYVGYGSFQKEVQLRGDLLITDIGQHNLRLVSHSLTAVEVKSEFIPILIKKDTIEYNANAFKTKPNAVVEDLLRKLPGIEVERDGTVKAQGEVVENILVDGKEFFGKDPTIATKNLPADIVDKVQVFDQKSELASFSGIDDGEEEKTINLKLKEGKNKGIFGNVSAAYGTEQRYESRFNINRFNKDVQLSAIGMANNTNEQGFSVTDYIEFMGGLQNLMANGGGELSLDGSEGIPLDMGGSQGVSKTIAGGLNFNYDFNKNTLWRSSYFLSDIQNDAERTTTSNHILREGSFSANSNSLSNTLFRNHKLNLKLTHHIDSSQSIILKGNLQFNQGKNKEFSRRASLNGNGLLQNDAINDYFSNAQKWNWSSQVIYRKKLVKKGRFISTSLNLGQLAQDREIASTSNTRFFDPQQSILFSNALDQNQEIDQQNMDYQFRLSYTEPLGKSKYLSFKLNSQNFRKTNQHDFYDLELMERIYNTQLSNQFTQDFRFEQIGANFRWNKKDFRLTTGLDYQRSILTGQIKDQANNVEKKFYRWLPHTFINYDIDNSQSLNFRYATRLQEPSLDQLQPVVNNSDPLRIYQGNPNLRAAFVHRLAMRYSLFDQFSFVSLFANATISYTEDKIQQKTSVDDLLRQVVTPINIGEEWTTRAGLSYGMPIKPLKVKFNLNTNLNYTKGMFFVNELLDQSQRWLNSYSLSLENRNKDWVDVIAGFRWNYNVNFYKESASLNQNYQDYLLFSEWSFYLKQNWVLEASIDHQIYSEEAFGESRTISLLNASISKSFSKTRFSLKLSAIDILNQNIGLSRYSDYNVTQESRTNAIGRFFLLTAGYKLSAFGASPLEDVKMRKRR